MAEPDVAARPPPAGRHHARPHRTQAGVFRALRLFGDAGRGRLDRLQRPSQHGLLQCAVRPRGGRGARPARLRPAIMSRTRKHSCFTAEVHVRYLRELHAGDPVRVTFQLLDYDAKRMHYFEQLFHASEGWMSATSENMSLHVDMAAKKTAPVPAGGGRVPGADARRPCPAAGAGSGRPPDRHAVQGLSCLLCA